jgi:hypothetical protein
VEMARERAQAIHAQLGELELRLQEDIAGLDAVFDAAGEKLEEIRLYPKRTDIDLRLFGLLWMPYRKEADGRMSRGWL